MGRRRNHSELDKQYLMKAFETGVSLEVMARNVGRSEHAVYMFFWNRGMSLKTRAPFTRAERRTRKVKKAHAEPADTDDKKRERKCLSCQKLFISDGPGNRICSYCKTVHSGAIDSPVLHMVDLVA